MSFASNGQNSISTLVLDEDNSIVLPYFDTSSIVNSNIESITLSLHVLDKIPKRTERLQITINPVDLSTNLVGDGLSTFVNVGRGNYVDFRLPRELFEQTVRTQKRLLVHLVGGGKKLILSGPDETGIAQDPKMIIEYSEKANEENLDQPRIAENQYYNIKNSQLHFGTGDNIGGHKIEKYLQESNKLWHEKPLGMLIITVVAGLIIAFLVYEFGWNK